MKKFLRKLHKFFYNKRISFYKNVLSEIKPAEDALLRCSALFIGKGKIGFGKNVTIGYYPSPDFYQGYSHFEARGDHSEIFIDEGTRINNHAVIIANETKISIGKNCRIGTNFQCFDSNFHGLTIKDRDNHSAVKNTEVKIGDNVFIGNNVIFLPGSGAGNGAVIGAGSVVTKFIPENTVAAGNPAKVIKNIEN